MATSQAQMMVQIDQDQVMVREWRFQPGDESGWHRHEYDFVVVPRTDGRLKLVSKEGVSTVELVAGQCYTRSAGLEHNVTNLSDHEVVILDVELKNK